MAIAITDPDILERLEERALSHIGRGIMADVLVEKIDAPLNKKRICVDIDGVICQYDFPKIVKNFFGVDLSAKMIFAYDLADVLGVAPALINVMFKEQVYGEPDFIDGAIETLTEWQSNGYELLIFSNRIKYMGFEGLRDWLETYFIPYTFINDGKWSYDIHIDDSPSKLMTTDSKLKLLFNQPWNEKCLNITGDLIQVRNWQEIREYENNQYFEDEEKNGKNYLSDNTENI